MDDGECWVILVSDLNEHLSIALENISTVALRLKTVFLFSSYCDLSIMSPYRHFLICLYGAVVLGLILAGQLRERKIIYILTGKYI